MQCSTCECPQASTTKHSTLYLVLTTLLMVTLVAFLAAAANRKDLRISTNSSLKSLSPHSNCQLWIQFHTISFYSQPLRPSTTHTAIVKPLRCPSGNHQHQYHYLKTTQHHSNIWKLLCAFLTPQHKRMLIKTDLSTELLGGEQGESFHLAGSSPEQWPLSPSLSSYPLVSFQFLNLNYFHSNLRSENLGYY